MTKIDKYLKQFLNVFWLRPETALWRTMDCVKMVQYLFFIYHKLPVKPFRKILMKLYRRYKLFNKDKIVVATRGGIKYRLDLNELIDSAIYYEGRFEPMTSTVIDKYVKQNMTVFDIGANIGCHTFRFAKLVGKNGKVIAFEPMSWAFSKLEDNIKLNDFDSILLEKVAFSNTSQRKTVYFKTSWRLNGGSSKKAVRKEMVNFMTLDEYVKRNNVKKIDFIKIDVDGYEYKIIQGAINSLKKFKPLMVVEFGKCTLARYGDNLERLIDLLASLGYSFYSEKDFRKYGDEKSILGAISPDSTINVLCKCEL